MLYIPFLQPLVDWLTKMIAGFAQWLNAIDLPFGINPIWMFSGLLVFGGVAFPFFGAMFYMAWKEQQRALLLTRMERDLNWWREPVCSLRQTSTILRSLNAEGSGHLSRLVNAYLLRMLYDGRLKPVAATDADGKGEGQALAIGRMQRFQLRQYDDDAEAEKLLFRMLKAAAGSDQVFQPCELTDYMKRHRDEFKTLVSLFRHKLTVAELKADSEEVRRVLGFRKFLREFTLSNERHACEVQLWRDYLVYATLFGCGEQVRRDMQELNPDFFKMDARIASINMGFELSSLEADLWHYSEEVQDFSPLEAAANAGVRFFKKK